MRSIAKLIIPTGLLALGACAGEATAPPTGPSLGISVAPLTLPGMTDACYGLTVFNVIDPTAFGEATQVWAQPSLCASQYGADGGIRFTGICDAQSTETDHANAVRLVLNDVYKDGTFDGGGTALTAGTDFVNPCPPPTEGQPDNGCVLTAPCTENQDSKIVFNLTVMRNASLGFFDTIVKFQDLFCAAKLDCVEDDGATTLDYLPIPGSVPPADGPTAVLAFACTAGEGAAGNYMYLDPVVVTCTDAGGNTTRTVTVDPSAGPGIVTPTQAAGDPILFSAAVNRGDGLNGSQYWNVLLGMNLPGVSGETCTVTTKGTASETPLTEGATPDHTRYPVVQWNVPLTVDGTRVCARHPLNNSGDDVVTTYTTVAAPEVLDYQLLRVAGEPGTVTPTQQVDYVLEQLENIPGGPNGRPTVLGDRIYMGFMDMTRDYESELWTSDGTVAGTIPLGDFNPGLASAYPAGFTAFAGEVFFRQDDGVHGYELWKTDGTPAGTSMVADVRPGATSPWLEMGRPVGGRLLFGANEGVHNTELWSTDGTAEGTSLLVELAPGFEASTPRNFVEFNNAVYFTANVPGIGEELWKSDGTASGTVLVADINPTGSAGVSALYRIGNRLFFSADDGVNGRELWASDGTDAGTHLVTDVNPSGGSYPSMLTPAGNKLYFFGWDENGVGGLWITDGATTTRLATVADPGMVTTYATGTRLFYTTGQWSSDLWTSDGTVAGTRALTPRDGMAGYGEFATLGTKTYFTRYEPAMGEELWETDGTVAGTHVTLEKPGTDGFSPSGIVRMGDSIYFSAFSSEPGFGAHYFYRYGPPR